MNKIKVSVPAVISKVMTMADRGLRLWVDTQEITDEELGAAIFGMKDKLGYFFFDEAQIREIDKTKLPPIKLEKSEKSPSERLRAVLYVFWEQQKISESFDIFYRRSIEKFISQIKEKLA